MNLNQLRIKKPSMHEWAKVFGSVLLTVLAFGSSQTWAETTTINIDGGSTYCHAREHASKLAKITALNKGNAACRALGPDWRFSKALESGQEDCKPCKSANEFRCTVTQANFECLKTTRPSRPKNADSTNTVSRASDMTPEIACTQAKLIASKVGTPGDCSCESKGDKRHVCTVYSSGPKSEPSAIQTLKAKLILEVEAWCEAHKPECEHPKHPHYIRTRSAATGVRG